MPMKPLATNTTPAKLAQLHHLLDAGQALSATFRGHLSNHLPMAQQALQAMGASAQRLQDWTEHYETFLEPRDDARPARIDTRRDLGRPDRDGAWRAHFASRIAQLGAAGALRETLPLLMPGAGAIAFHGLIRTGHAVLAGHDGELAAGLAHWASHFMPLPADEGGSALALQDWLQALAALPRPDMPPGALIAGRMQTWGASAPFAAVAGRLCIGPDTLRELALLAARTYAATRNFTVLHLLTGCHAMRVLAPWWPTPALPRSFAVAAAAGLLASGAAPVPALDALPGHPWPTLISAACAQDDAHVIKLTHAAWQLDGLWPDPAWRQAAARAIPV